MDFEEINIFRELGELTPFFPVPTQCRKIMVLISLQYFTKSGQGYILKGRVCVSYE